MRPFFSDKFEITKYPKYKYLSDADPKNAFDMEKHIKRRPTIVKPDEEFDVLQTLVIALGAGLGIWDIINFMEGYGRRECSCTVKKQATENKR